MGTNRQGVSELRRPAPTRASRRVLCVDDDVAIARLLARWLGRQGYEAVATCDPLLAAEQLGSTASPFDALITDQNMPNMTGLELARLAVSARPRLVVFLSTAKDDCLHPDDLAGSGVRYLVAKPFDLDSIAVGLDEALGGPQRPRLVRV